MTTNEPESKNGQTPAPSGEELPTVFIDDVLMSLKYYVDEHESHIKIIAPEICMHCESQGCLYFCPVGAYRAQANGEIQISFQSCIECGSCRVMCPHNNVQWKYPRGGFGISYKFG
jgi:ferredoxin like protein